MSDDDVFLALAAALPAVLALGLYYGVARRNTARGLGAVLAWNVGLAALLASLALLVLEIDFRFFRDTTDSFSMTRVSERWFERHVRMNGWDLRDDVEYAYAPTPGRPRLSFVGDSFTAGHGVDVGQRFASLIRARRNGWEVHALARNGMDTGDELRLVESLARKGYVFDRVVLVYVPNDIGDLVGEWKDTKARLKDDVSRHAALFPIRSSWFLNTLYYRWLALSYPDVTNYYHGIAKAYRGRVWKRQQARLVALDDAVRTANGRLLVVIFPFLQGATRADDEFSTARREVRRLFESRGVPVLDLSPAFSGRSARSLVVNAWDAHPNPLAHALAADAIERFVEPYMEERRP